MDLDQVLPKDHPYLKENSHYLVTKPDRVADLVDVLEDWKRSMATWDEVEDKLNKVKEDIHESTQ